MRMQTTLLSIACSAQQLITPGSLEWFGEYNKCLCFGHKYTEWWRRAACYPSIFVVPCYRQCSYGKCVTVSALNPLLHISALLFKDNLPNRSRSHVDAASNIHLPPWTQKRALVVGWKTSGMLWWWQWGLETYGLQLSGRSKTERLYWRVNCI